MNDRSLIAASVPQPAQIRSLVGVYNAVGTLPGDLARLTSTLRLMHITRNQLLSIVPPICRDA